MNETARRLTGVEKQAALARIIDIHRRREVSLPPAVVTEVPESFYKIDKFPRYAQMQLHRALADQMGLKNPFFTRYDSAGRDTAMVDGHEVLNFSTYNYLGLNGDARVAEAAHRAALQFGTSASASRVVGGERPPHRQLENILADLHGTEDAIAFVSGFVANVSLVSTLVGPKDLVLLDRLIHNSVVQGAKLSEAAIITFPHNDWEALDAILAASRARYERVLIVVEGIYSMEGDICPLPQLVEIKARHKALLMVDEAHSIGVLGRQGRGVGEHFGVAGSKVDIWMGTLSKSFAGCGGYAAGTAAMVELMKFSAGGFVYSVGMPPPMAAASICAIQIMLAEPRRLQALAMNGQYMLSAAKAAGFDTGLAAGANIVPVITGSSLTAVRLSNRLLEQNIAINPIIFPAVEDKQARLRLFVSADHSTSQIDRAVQVIAAGLDEAGACQRS